MKYRKKPVVIEAVQWDGTKETADHLTKWGKGEIIWHFNQNIISIGTLEGVMVANIGDWIICGVRGEFYPCKPDIFTATYELAEDINAIHE